MMPGQKQVFRSARTFDSSGKEPFAHIRVIRQPQTDLQQSEPESPQPTFRNPSLTSETEASLESYPLSSSNNHSASSESLASCPQGVTFAARARAAELQAARSRRELKSRDINFDTPHETMTFKPKSARKKWNTLDLATLPDPEEDSPTRNSASSQHRDDAEATPRADPRLLYQDSRQDENTAAASSSSNMQPTFADMLRAEPEPVSFQSESLEGPRYTTEHLNMSTEQPQRPGKENVPYSGIQAPPGFSLEPVPVLSGANQSDWDREHTEQLLKKQEKQIADLTERLRVQSSLANQQPPPGLKPGLTRSMPDFSTADPFTGRQLEENVRQVPQRRYPAVKGTTENTMRPTIMGINPPPGLGSKAVATRRASEEGKGCLVRHLNSIAETTSSDRQSLTSQSLMDLKASSSASADVLFDRSELLAASEPLPWKDRRVPIAIDRLPGYQGYAPRPSTPKGHRHLPSVLDGLASPRHKKSKEEELNDWWTRDNRVDIRSKQEINEFIAEIDTKRQIQRQADRAALKAANFSDERSSASGPSSGQEEDTSDMGHTLLLPVLANLRAYQTDRPDHFNRFAPPPSWAIDHTAQGNDSFFSQGWGIPPPRVGRDPRYRAVQHDGRSSVFEDPTGKLPREEYNRHNNWW